MYKVLIDTSAYEKEGCSFQGPKFERLQNLTDTGYIKIVTSSIITNEVRRHISQSLTSFASTIKRAFKAADHIVKPDFEILADLKKEEKTLADRMVASRLAKVDKFFRSIEIEELEHNINVESLIKDYFEKRPPFSEGKKNEFPDAIVLNAFIQKYGSSTEQLCVVSADSDYTNYCKSHPEIQVFDSIGSFIDFINSNKEEILSERLHAEMGALSHRIEKKIAELVFDGVDFTFDPEWIDPEAEMDEESIQVKITSYKLISGTETSADWEVSVSLSYSVHVTAPDPDSMFKDYDTREWIFANDLQLTAQTEREFDMVIETTFDLEDIQYSFEIDSIEVPSDIYDLDGAEFEEVDVEDEN